MGREWVNRCRSAAGWKGRGRLLLAYTEKSLKRVPLRKLGLENQECSATRQMCLPQPLARYAERCYPKAVADFRALI
jgi:hypothetical protein